MTAKRQSFRVVTPFFAVLAALAPIGSRLAAQSGSDRVIVVTLDGMRWQEVFGGADRSLITGRDGGVADTGWTLSRFWRPDAPSRRTTLFPFLGGVVAREGVLLGDSTRGSQVRVTNGKWFSYPGYSELMTGRADDRIDSNDKIPNPNVTVLEWLAGRPGFRNSIEIYGSWDVFPSIFNTERSGLPVNDDGPPFPAAQSDREREANRFASWLPNHWRGVRLDAPTMTAAFEALRTRAPRVLVVLLGETDEWAHGRQYDLYLDAAQRADRFIAELWNLAQSLPAYRGRTTLLVATDHGRGLARDWTDHGRDVPAAERIWMAALGPAIAPLGLDSGVSGTQSQFAATIARAVGEQWQSARPNAAPPLERIFRAPK
ncbi:MAG: alkaline phosphatase family protein [Gemmatimonadales bacterium]